MSSYKTLLLTVSLFGLTFLLSGCAQDKPAANGKKSNNTGTKMAADDHSGWWCAEHGIPEEECSMCSASAAKDFKAKGDWCDEHSRAKSQCFQCDPSLAGKYAKLYEAKYGKKPPAVTE